MTDVLPAGRTEMLDLEAKYTAAHGEFFFTGIQALVRIPLDQMRADRAPGLRTAGFISGYQGSPLGGFDRELIDRKALLERHGIVHRPGLNEELGATAVMGSQLSSTFPEPTYDGVVGIWYGKAPGLDRAGDAIRHGNYAGTSRAGGVLALAGDDPACKSSTLPSGSEYTLHDLHLPVIYPGNVQEILDFGLHGIALSRASGLWCGVKIVTAGGRRRRHRRGPPRAHPPGRARRSSSGAGPTCRPCQRLPAAAALQRRSRRRSTRRASSSPAATRELNPGLNAHHRRPPDADAWLGIVALGPHLLRGRRGAAEAGPRRGRPAPQRRAAAAAAGWSTRSSRRSCDASPGASRRSSSSRRSAPSSRSGLKDAPLRHAPVPPPWWASATPRAAALVPAAGALDADALVDAAAPTASGAASTPPAWRRRRPPPRPRLGALPQAGRTAARPHPVLLLRLPAQHRHEGARTARWSAAASAATAWCC